MNKEQIKQTWRNLFIPFSVGTTIVITGTLWYIFASHKNKMSGFFLSLFGVILLVSAALKMNEFKRYLKDNNLK